MAILQDLSQTQLIERIAMLEAQNKVLMQRGKAKGKLGLTENGHLTLRGFRKYGMFGFKGEWQWIVENVDQIRWHLENSNLPEKGE